MPELLLQLGQPGLRRELINYSKNIELKTKLYRGFNPQDVIRNTREGKPLSQNEILNWVNGVANNVIPDYQTSAWLMAVCMRQPPLTMEETTNLTLAMAASGDILDLDEFGIVADKHSSGGVGDKTTLVVAPIVAACGIRVGKMTGRGLGHTGGTLDKLESIPGFRVDLTRDEFLRQTKEVGIVVTGQTGELAPADGKLYALRDVTETVDNIPLIAASIMSKKIASGANHLVLDVKVGQGAFMKTIEDARQLARTMVEIGKMVGMTVVAEITNMNQPLGEAVGNSLEVLEAIETLKGKGPDDFYEHCIETSARMILISQKAENMEEAMAMVRRTIEEGDALEKFRVMVRAQGGDERVIDDPTVLKIAKQYSVCYEGDDGFVNNVDPMAIGIAAMNLGGGRKRKEDKIDHSVGIVVKAKVGKPLQENNLIGYVYSDNPEKAEEAKLSLQRAVTTSLQQVEDLPVSLETYPEQI
ncbi:MAG: thymidine phosphorylase [Candidatus Roizmanbacteria bacterium]|nr:thymidine phosphorylase [Candidatus Roizmanbacteria bacterium]